MTLLTTWPAVVDDLGDRKSGTVWSAAHSASQKAAIEAIVHSLVNPGVSPADAIDELVAARGSLATLSLFLLVSHYADGTLKLPASLAALSDVQAMVGHGNWVYNDDLLIWPAGDAAAPVGYVQTGAGAAIARCGNGLADTTTKVGPFCMKVTRAAADTTVAQNLMNTTSFSAAGAYWKGRKFGFGAWVNCAIGSIARLSFYDGVTTTDATNPVTGTTYHSGTGLWQWLSGVHTVSGTATQLAIQAKVLNSAGDAYFSGITAMPGTQAPAAWVPCPKVYGAAKLVRAGTLVVATDADEFQPARPLLVKDVQLACLTAPTGQAAIVDVNVWDGAAWQSMCSTKPQIAATARRGGVAPDGTYRYRCLTGSRGTTVTNSLLNFDIDQVGSGVAGDTIYVHVRALQYARPQESMLDVADF